MFNRVRRVRGKEWKAHRQNIGKFQYFTEGEDGRKASCELAETMKQQNVNVCLQWPQQVEEARKELYPVMIKEKQNGKKVKLVRDKLFIDVIEYKVEH